MNSTLGTCSCWFAFSKAVGRSFFHFKLLFVSAPLLRYFNAFLFFLKRITLSNKILHGRMKTRINLNRKGLMGCPAILLTLINNLGTIGTWFSSPSHVIHPTCSSVVLPLLSFGTLRSLGSSLSKMSLVFFRTNRAWEWLVFARLACFSWKQKRFAIFVSLEVQLKMASLKSQYHFVGQFCCCAIFLSSDCVTNSLYSNFFAFATFRSLFSLMKCLRNSRTSLSKVYYFTVALEAALVGKLLSCWRVYLLIVYL